MSASNLKLTGEDWTEILYGPSAAQVAGPVTAPYSMGSMNVSAGLTEAQKKQPFDYSWLLYAGIGIALLVMLKGKR